MAITTTSRFGLKLYSSGTDAHPTRVDFNAMINSIEAVGVIGDQGLASARPTANKGHRVWWSSDTSRFYWDDGTAWQEITNVGGGGAGAPVVVAGTASEGSSNRNARADHTHNLPIATISVAGAMSAADKSKLDSATSSATPSQLVIRDSSGRTQVGTPAVSSDAANKGYVDSTVAGASPASHTHDAGAVISGVFDPARLPAASTTAQGALSAADKTKLDAAASIPTASTLVVRDASGRARFADPSVAADASTKGYVDGQINTHGHANATSSINGFMSATDKIAFDAAASAATPSVLMKRDGSGRAKVASPSASDDIATKAYADSVGTGKRSDTPPFAHMGATDLGQTINSLSPKKVTYGAAQILKGGFTFDNANDALVVPVTGWYEVVIKGYMYSVSSTAGDGTLWAEAYVNSVLTGIKIGLFFEGGGDCYDLSAVATGLVKINAGEKVQMYMWSDPSANLVTFGSNGWDGTYVEVRWYAADA
jgi:hypothetical protein